MSDENGEDSGWGGIADQYNPNSSTEETEETEETEPSKETKETGETKETEETQQMQETQPVEGTRESGETEPSEETKEMGESGETDSESPVSDLDIPNEWGERTVRESENVNMYLPPSVVERLRAEYARLNAEYVAEYGEDLPKNSVFYSLILDEGMDSDGVRRRLGLDDGGEGE